MSANNNGGRGSGLLLGIGLVEALLAVAGWVVVLATASFTSKRSAALVCVLVALLVGVWLVLLVLRSRRPVAQAPVAAEVDPPAQAPLVATVDPPARAPERAQPSRSRAAIAFLDDLTGLPARPWFEHSVRSEIARSVRYGHALSLVVIDADGFSRLNEARGTAIGDYILLTIADVLRTGVRQSDQVSRVADDEFAIVVPDTDIAGAGKVGEKIRRAIELYPFDEGIEVTVSVGVTTVAGGDTAESFLLRGEAAVTTARQRGGNACVISQT